MKSQRIDITGRRYGRLTVIEYDHTEDRKAYWKCKCDCGAEKIVRGSHLAAGKIRSCGCLSKEMASQRQKTHGKSKTRIYNVWAGIKQRCYNPNFKKYNRYGGRGITMCKEWQNSFDTFYDWAMANGYSDGLTIDRIDNNGNYCPENCRWVTYHEQNCNYSRNRLVAINGQEKPVAVWAEELQMPYDVLYNRIFTYGWTIEDAITRPIRSGKHD